MRCSYLLRVLRMADSFLDCCMLRASAQYFWQGSISKLNLMVFPDLKTRGSSIYDSALNRQNREQLAPRSSKALLSSALTFWLILSFAPMTYHPTRMNSSQQFMLSCPFRSLRVSYSIMRSTISAGEMLLVPRGAVRVILQDSSCWRAQRRPQETPQLLGTFLPWQMAIPTRLIGAITTCSYISLQRLIIFVMIVSRSLGTFFHLSQPAWTFLTSNPQRNFELFFREIQKSSQTHEAIRVYESYAGKNEGYEKYLATTMRILSRLTKSQDEHQIQNIREFLWKYRGNIMGVDVERIKIQNLKDFLLFFYQYSEFTVSVTPDVTKIIQKYLIQFLKRHQKCTTSEKLLYASTLFSCIRLAHLHCPLLHEPTVRNVVALLYSHSETFITDNLTFNNLLHTVRQIYDPKNSSHEHLLHSIFLFLSMQELKDIFDEDGLANILITIHRIKSEKFELNANSTKVLLNEIEDVIEDILCEGVMRFRQRSIDIMLSGLISQGTNSRLVQRYMKIIQLSLDSDGKAKINPLSIIWSINLLEKKYFNKLFDMEWQKCFVKMLKVYFGKENKFQKSIHFELLSILEKGLFQEQVNAELYQFCFKEYHCHKKLNFFFFFKLTIKQAFIHALHSNKTEQIRCLKRIDEYTQILVSEWFEKKESPSFLIDVPQLIKSLYGISGEQVLLESKTLDRSPGQLNKTWAFIQLKGELLTLQIKLAYQNQKNDEVEHILSKISKDQLLSKQLKLVFKEVLVNANISSQHFSQFFTAFSRLFQVANISLEQTLFDLVYFKAKQGYCTAYLAQLTSFYYKQYHPELELKLKMLRGSHFTAEKTVGREVV